LDGDHFPWYAIDGKISRTVSSVFSTGYELSQYFILELDSLTKVVGITITSKDEDATKVTHLVQNTNDEYIEKESGIQSIKDAEIRAGTTKRVELCEGCSFRKDLELCGTLKIEKNESILPLREYSVMCHKSILTRVVTVLQSESQVMTSLKRSLTFEEISVIRGNFLDTSVYFGKSNSIHGSPGTLIYIFKWLLVVYKTIMGYI
jgi:hypothetical protein